MEFTYPTTETVARLTQVFGVDPRLPPLITKVAGERDVEAAFVKVLRNMSAETPSELILEGDRRSPTLNIRADPTWNWGRLVVVIMFTELLVAETKNPKLRMLVKPTIEHSIDKWFKSVGGWPEPEHRDRDRRWMRAGIVGVIAVVCGVTYYLVK
uniref:Protein ORF33 n=1 Tax=Anguillid herpesvirus 1 TaxID=150286 RepID=A0A8E5ETA2_9VIRU|nr:protein ORF33 [Anguillid herpesvirus 1]